MASSSLYKYDYRKIKSIISLVLFVLNLQISPAVSSSLMLSSRLWNNIGIEKWVESYVTAKNLSGMLSFDIMVDKFTNEVYATQCRPGLHSSIVKLNDIHQVCKLNKRGRRPSEFAQELRFLIKQGSAKMKKIACPKAEISLKKGSAKNFTPARELKLLLKKAQQKARLP